MRNEYKRYLDGILAQRRIPGAGVFVGRKGQALFDEGVGLADRQANRPVTSDTVFGIGSVTKSFTALAIMQLQDAGKLRVSNKVVEYLPALGSGSNKAYEGITLHHLLTNSSGLPPLPFLARALGRSVLADVSKELMEIKAESYEPFIDTTDELVQVIVDAAPKLHRDPGVIFSYSNEGFAMLGRIIEVVSGKFYDDYIAENILQPLGMTRSLIDPAGLEALGDVTELYSYIQGYERVESTPGWWQAPSMTAAGFLKCTAKDLARYGQVYMGKHPDVLSPQSLVAMTTPHIRASGLRYYGYGLMVQDYHGHKLVEHGGNLKGMGAWMSVVPDADVVSVVLTNITGGPVGDMVLYGLNLVLGLPADTKRDHRESVQVSATDIRSMTGKYISGEATELTLSVGQDGALQAFVGKLQMPVRVVSATSVVVDANGADALIEFIDPSEHGFGAATFGFRVLERVN